MIVIIIIIIMIMYSSPNDVINNEENLGPDDATHIACTVEM